MAFDHERLEVGAGGVEGGGVTRASGAHNHNVTYVHISKTVLVDRFRKIHFASDRKAGTNYGFFLPTASALVEARAPR